MNKVRYWAGAGLCFAAAVAANGASAQAGNYPSKPVTIITDAPPGSTPDVDARFVAEGLGKKWGQQVIVIQHAGANGSLAARAATDATPDGYTLFMPALSTFVALPIAKNLPVKLPRDFIPIGYTAENPMFFAVSPSLPINTLPELIAYAKSNPGKVTIANTGVGRLTDLTSLLLQEKAGIQLIPVPYNGGPAAAVADVAGGRVSMIIEGYSGIVGAVKAKQIRLIAVAATQRLPQFPDVPIVGETIPGFTAMGWQVLVAPLKTPARIVAKVSADLSGVVSDQDFKNRLANIGSYSRAMTPEQALAFVDGEQAKWGPVVAKVKAR